MKVLNSEVLADQLQLQSNTEPAASTVVESAPADSTPKAGKQRDTEPAANVYYMSTCPCIMYMYMYMYMYVYMFVHDMYPDIHCIVCGCPLSNPHTCGV